MAQIIEQKETSPQDQLNKKQRKNTLTFNEVWAEIFEEAVSKDKLYAEVRAGRIPHVRIGTKILFRRDTLEAWFESQEKAHGNNPSNR